MQPAGRGAQGNQVAIHVAASSVAIVVIVVVVTPLRPPPRVRVSYEPLPVHDAVGPGRHVEEKCECLRRVRRMLATPPPLGCGASVEREVIVVVGSVRVR
jgi:hypothetical protein